MISVLNAVLTKKHPSSLEAYPNAVCKDIWVVGWSKVSCHNISQAYFVHHILLPIFLIKVRKFMFAQKDSTWGPRSSGADHHPPPSRTAGMKCVVLTFSVFEHHQMQHCILSKLLHFDLIRWSFVILTAVNFNISYKLKPPESGGFSVFLWALHSLTWGQLAGTSAPGEIGNSPGCFSLGNYISPCRILQASLHNDNTWADSQKYIWQPTSTFIILFLQSKI